MSDDSKNKKVGKAVVGAVDTVRSNRGAKNTSAGGLSDRQKEKYEELKKKVRNCKIQSVFFWGSGEANSQTNSLQKAADRPNRLQTVYSSDSMASILHGQQTA